MIIPAPLKYTARSPNEGSQQAGCVLGEVRRDTRCFRCRYQLSHTGRVSTIKHDVERGTWNSGHFSDWPNTGNKFHLKSFGHRVSFLLGSLRNNIFEENINICSIRSPRGTDCWSTRNFCAKEKRRAAFLSLSLITTQSTHTDTRPREAPHTRRIENLL